MKDRWLTRHIQTLPKADTAKHARIKELNNKGLTKEEIAKAVGCGVATVYRVIKPKNRVVNASLQLDTTILE